MAFLWVGVGSVLVPLLVGMVLWGVGRVAMGVWRWLAPPAVDFDPQAQPLRTVPPGWAPMVLLVGVACVPLWVWLSPDAAQLERGWQQLRGYPATVLTIPLQDDSPAARAAVLQLLDPLRTVGSRRIDAHHASRHGGWTDTAVVPVYYRVQDKHLQVALARSVPDSVLAYFSQVLHAVQTEAPETLPWVTLAQLDCRLEATRPLVPWESRTAQLQAQMQQMRQCQGPRARHLEAAGAAVAGRLGALEHAPAARFSPWWSREWSEWGSARWEAWTPIPAPAAAQP